MVLSNSKQKLVNLSEVDRVSNLHDSLISHILSFLPTKKQAIATSILSKRWRYIWTLIDENVFTNAYVFFNVTIDNQPVGRVVVELFNVTNPKTAENVNTLGEKGSTKMGKPFIFHRVNPHFMYEGGDLGAEYIYMYKFDDDIFVERHTSPGILSMDKAGPGTNSSKFFICTDKTEWLCGNHMVSGQVVGGIDVLKAIHKVGSSSGRTSKPVVVTDCGWI